MFYFTHRGGVLRVILEIVPITPDKQTNRKLRTIITKKSNENQSKTDINVRISR